MSQEIHYLETGSQDPFYNLAFEETVLRSRRSGEYLLLWQNDNTIVIGQNQNAEGEINRAFVEAHQIHVVRRTTGGGAVYHDLGNLNYTFVNREGEGSQAMQQQVLLGMMRPLGVDAVFSGRNDILVEGRKISGQAGYCEGGNEYLHGTLMVRVNKDHLEKSLRPSRIKLESKGVRSVAGRVANLSEYIPDITPVQAGGLMAGQFRQVFGPCLPVVYRDGSQGRPRQQDTYESRDWIVDNCPEYTVSQEMRWNGGILKLRFQVRDGTVLHAGCSSDSLTCGDIAWIRELEGYRYDREQIVKIIMERGK